MLEEEGAEALAEGIKVAIALYTCICRKRFWTNILHGNYTFYIFFLLEGS